MFPILTPQRKFNVLDLPGIFGWLNMTNVAGTGINPPNNSARSLWAELTPNAYNFTEANGAKQPVFRLNQQGGKPGLDFIVPYNLSGPNAFMTKLGGAFTIYVVSKAIATNDLIAMVATPDELTNRFNLLAPFAATTSILMDVGNVFAGNRLTAVESDIFTQAYVHCFRYDPSDSNRLSIYRNGVLKATLTSGGTFTPGAKIPRIGFEFTTGMYFEIIACDVPHTLSTIVQTSGYAKSFWSLP